MSCVLNFYSPDTNEPKTTEEFFRENYLSVNVYYGTMRTEYMTQTKQVEGWEFISELGKRLSTLNTWRMMYSISHRMMFATVSALKQQKLCVKTDDC